MLEQKIAAPLDCGSLTGNIVFLSDTLHRNGITCAVSQNARCTHTRERGRKLLWRCDVTAEGRGELWWHHAQMNTGNHTQNTHAQCAQQYTCWESKKIHSSKNWDLRNIFIYAYYIFTLPGENLRNILNTIQKKHSNKRESLGLQLHQSTFLKGSRNR